MNSDLDPFDDILTRSTLAHARPGGKFQPRAKPQPKKAIRASVPSVLLTNDNEKSVSSLPTMLDTISSQSVNTNANRSTSPLSSSPASSTLPKKEEHLEDNDEYLRSETLNPVTHLVSRTEDLASAETDASQLDLDSFAGIISDVKKAVHVVHKTLDPVGASLPDHIFDIHKPLKDNEVVSLDSNNKLVNLSSKKIENKKDMSSKDDHAEVNGMGVIGPDLDPFADIVPPPSVGNARTGGKFQPRAKVQPRKGTSETVAIAVSRTTMEENMSPASAVSNILQLAKFVNVGGGMLSDPVDSSLTTFGNFIENETSRKDDYKNSEALSSNDDQSYELVNSSQLPGTDVVHLGVATKDPHPPMEKSVGENADIFSGLDYIHDFVTQSPSCIDIPVPVLNNKEIEAQSRLPAQDSVNSSALRVCNVATQDPIYCNKEVVQNNYRPVLEDIGVSSHMEMPNNFPESTIESGCHARKLQRKPKAGSEEKSTVNILTPDAVDSVVCPSNMAFDPSETVCMEGSIRTFPSDDVYNCPSMSFRNVISQDPPRSGFSNEDQINIANTSHYSDLNVMDQEDLPEETAKESSRSRKRKSASVSNPSHAEGHSPSIGDMGGSGKFSRQQRKRTPALQLVDEQEDEANDVDGPSKASSHSTADQEDDCDYRVDEDNNEDKADTASCKKRVSKKPKKATVDKGKRGSRCKKDDNASEQSTQKPHKKFSRSTQRKNRLKDLLSMPEEEIDFQRLPVRDIILFAGYKECVAIKEANASKNISTNQSATNSLEDPHNKDDNVTSEQDGGCDNDQSNLLFNCHSFMDKTPTARWSKQDTELFYEGIQQFGTDLSMIQQLFPGRTRHQIKLKYKKEERQHPLRLSEALSNRAKDHSHFEKVIEQLQQVAAQAEQESYKDASVGVSDEEAELNPENNEEMTKPERDDENATVEDQQGDAGEVHNDPWKDDEDDDDDIWSSYKSVF